MNGFYEFGLTALLAFGFINLVGGWMWVSNLPPIGQAEKSDYELGKLEEGISMEGAKLVTPQMAEKTPVA